MGRVSFSSAIKSLLLNLSIRYDEGTAYMPVVSSKQQLPQPGQFLSLDADGYDLPSDWFVNRSIIY